MDTLGCDLKNVIKLFLILLQWQLMSADSQSCEFVVDSTGTIVKTDDE